jgi:hypothetical protein
MLSLGPHEMAAERLSAVLLCEPPDKAGRKRSREFNGARCVLSTGQIVEVHRRRAPLYDLTRSCKSSHQPAHPVCGSWSR